MKQMISLVLGILLLTSIGFGQSIEDILAEVEQNNTHLAALRMACNAELMENKTGIFLENPEFEFHYLWSDPTNIGQRTDVSITQSFDFPTVYSHQSAISDIKNEQVELRFLKEQKSLVLETRLLLLELIYYNALNQQLKNRLTHAQSIASSYQSKFNAGECNILEYNKSQLNLLNLQKELESIEIERQLLLAQLRTLNGGKALVFDQSQYETVDLPLDFEQWYAQAEAVNPVLNWIKQELELSQRKIKLSKAQSLPKLQAGYMSEAVGVEKFQGLIVGLSIPLWENKNTVKFAKANTEAMLSLSTDRKLEFYHHLRSLYEKSNSLMINTTDYREQLSKYEHSELLNKALDKGQITLIDYMLELAIYYKSQDNLLEMERNLNLTLAELYQFM